MAETALSPTFQNDTAQNSYDVHVLIQRWDGDIVDMQMPYDPNAALHFKSHGLMKELDVDKLEADGVISGADSTASYYSFNDYAAAVTADYNEAIKGAASVYNDIMAEVDPGKPQSTMTPEKVDGVYDVNKLYWESTNNVLGAAIDSARLHNERTGTNDMDPLIEQGTLAMQNLADSGANIVHAARDMFFGNIPKPAYVDLTEPPEFVDFSQYEIGSESTANADIKPVQ